MLARPKPAAIKRLSPDQVPEAIRSLYRGAGDDFAAIELALDFYTQAELDKKDIRPVVRLVLRHPQIIATLDKNNDLPAFIQTITGALDLPATHAMIEHATGKAPNAPVVLNALLVHRGLLLDLITKHPHVYDAVRGKFELIRHFTTNDWLRIEMAYALTNLQKMQDPTAADMVDAIELASWHAYHLSLCALLVAALGQLKTQLEIKLPGTVNEKLDILFASCVYAYTQMADEVVEGHKHEKKTPGEKLNSSLTESYGVPAVLVECYHLVKVLETDPELARVLGPSLAGIKKLIDKAGFVLPDSYGERVKERVEIFTTDHATKASSAAAAATSTALMPAAPGQTAPAPSYPNFEKIRVLVTASPQAEAEQAQRARALLSAFTQTYKQELTDLGLPVNFSAPATFVSMGALVRTGGAGAGSANTVAVSAAAAPADAVVTTSAASTESRMRRLLRSTAGPSGSSST